MRPSWNAILHSRRLLAPADKATIVRHHLTRLATSVVTECQTQRTHRAIGSIAPDEHNVVHATALIGPPSCHIRAEPGQSHHPNLRMHHQHSILSCD